MSAMKKTAPATTVIEQPFSRVVINEGEALDHAIMRAKQLVDLLDVLGGTDPTNLMWLAQQIAGELVEAVNLVDEDPRNGGAA